MARPTLSFTSEKPRDITYNLPYLQFESALSDEEKTLLYLRKRSHATTVTACAQATYFVLILNEARQVQKYLHDNPKRPQMRHLLKSASSARSIVVGILGCGHLGSHLAHCLLTFAEMNPEEILVSTRRPETLVELQDKGVRCFNNNVQVAANVSLLFLCVPPSQVASVAEEIKGKIRADCIVYSMAVATPIQRLRRLFQSGNIIRPECELGDADKAEWDCTMEVMQAFTSPSMLQTTCPLSGSDGVVRTNEKVAAEMVYAFINLCTQLNLTSKETVDVVNAVVLGHSNKSPVSDIVYKEDITSQTVADDELFDKFDLCSLDSPNTPLLDKLRHSSTVRQAFTQKYCARFQQYVDWRNQALQQAQTQLHFI